MPGATPVKSRPPTVPKLGLITDDTRRRANLGGGGVGGGAAQEDSTLHEELRVTMQC